MASRSLLPLAIASTIALAAPTTRLMPRDSNPSIPLVPQFVVDFAPIVHLTTNDPYQPSDIMAQITNTHVDLNLTSVPSDQLPNPLDLSSIGQLNNLAESNGGLNVYLSSNQDFNTVPPPAYLNGVKPDSQGKTGDAKSCAIIVNEKANGVTDAFYMYFYAYNLGNTVLGHELGDHVGDWEHNMIRFVNGTPTWMWYSQHANGEAFDWTALEFSGKRPVSYSANGTHANYATVGGHDHAIPDVDLPDGFVLDTTDAGPIWDPTLSTYYYSVSFPASQADGDSSNPSFAPLSAPSVGVDGTNQPTSWLDYRGQWGDDQLPSSDKRQKSFFGFQKYTGGPTGPEDKQLNRVKVCPDDGDLCILRPIRTPGS